MNQLSKAGGWSGSIWYTIRLGIVQQEDDADDVTQEVLYRFTSQVSSFKGESKFSTWLYRITGYKIAGPLKQKKDKNVLHLYSACLATAMKKACTPKILITRVLMEQKEKSRHPV